MGSINEFSNEFNIVKLANKIVRLCAALAVLAVITATLLHVRSAVGILRLVIAFVFLFGGLTLLGSAVERVWSVILRFAKRRQVNYPRTATGISLGLILFLIEILLMVAVKMQDGRMVAGVIAIVFLLVGGGLVAGKWLSSGWAVASKVFRKGTLTGDENS